jgi:N-carbamoyl-L-amino-acid hydrolase
MKGIFKHGVLTLLLAVSAYTLADVDSPLASAERMENRIFALGEFGKNSNGGVDRVAYSDADLAARAYMISEMKNAGLDVHVDFAGNIIGQRDGKTLGLAPIMFGSHIDSVPGGGNYDGDVGVVGALEVVELLNTAGIVTDHPLQMIIFADEEGGTVGSMALAGILPEEALRDVSASGFTRGEGIDRLGGDQTKLQLARRATPIHAFVELHIEQGGFLEAKNLDIGIVEGIVGISWWTVAVEGVANHGGTTPMPGRRDALVAASRLIVAINESATTMAGQQVATVGKIEAFPGAPNVIPGRVEFSLEIRDLESAKIDRVLEVVQAAAAGIEQNMSVAIRFEASHANILPAPTNASVRTLIEASIQALGLSYQTMPSGAGHDAQDMAPITPTGMIFVPSRGGVSHSPQEFTAADDMANGANVLLHTLLKLDSTTFN